jgi:hypothetical protein
MLIMTRIRIRMTAIFMELMMLPLLLLLLVATVTVNETIFIVTNDVSSRSSGKSGIIEIHRDCVCVVRS